MTKLGYQIPNFTYPDVAPADLFGVIARQAREADESGFDTVMVMDHFYQLPMLGPPELEMLECYTLLSALAQHTSTVRLSALVTGNTYRNPTLLAKTLTTLDVVSGGRAQLGIGAGWFEQEHDSLGFEFLTFTERFEKLEEALQIITGMFRSELPTLDGKWYQVREAINSPAPLGHIPIMIGGGGEKKTLRLVAQYADESNLICGVDEIGRKLDALAGHCERLGRDRSEITVSYQGMACIAPTHDEAVAELDALLLSRGMDVATMSAEDAAAMRAVLPPRRPRRDRRAVLDLPRHRRRRLHRQRAGQRPHRGPRRPPRRDARQGHRLKRATSVLTYRRSNESSRTWVRRTLLPDGSRKDVSMP
ncbi:LLM class F420-dependent oxidoreductase [Aquihabitans sp. G128]|uniref:LLM class F420-dependent oxidoreductase n=1 Tax=Aquihabitans sp. G128 TaxID=2849779 RepID=UPI001C21C771|nr:LLM class F420-dependent oxidoreductase [Aquihabitans sp. G128]QXC61763.1 LLM class F420-dependent oxidoreductase [Aquihabitans sp. G128]